MDGKQIKIVYTIVERNSKTYWLRIGVGSVNRDGSLNLTLDAMPANGQIHVRDWEPREEGAGAGSRGNGHAEYGARANA